MAITTVQVRIIADTRDEALSAIAELRSLCGTTRIIIGSPSEGRKGQFLAYGSFQFEGSEPPTITAPPAATGKTQRLAATGKTRRLR